MIDCNTYKIYTIRHFDSLYSLLYATIKRFETNIRSL